MNAKKWRPRDNGSFPAANAQLIHERIRTTFSNFTLYDLSNESTRDLKKVHKNLKKYRKAPHLLYLLN